MSGELCEARRSDGAPCTLQREHLGQPHAYAGIPFGSVSLVLDEMARQLVLLALAHLSVARPGWENALHALALQVDNQNNGRALMFDEFRATCRTEIVDLKLRLESKQNALMVLVGLRDGTTPWTDHKARHVVLHAMLDELVADWSRHTEKRPSSSSVLELMNWANEQRLNPTSE